MGMGKGWAWHRHGEGMDLDMDRHNMATMWTWMWHGKGVVVQHVVRGWIAAWGRGGHGHEHRSQHDDDRLVVDISIKG